VDAGDRKPIDAGTGRVCASWDPDSGAWLSFGGPHAVHGFVELAAAAPFDESLRGRPDAVRAYRLSLADPRHAIVEVLVEGRRPRLRPIPDDPGAPRWVGEGITVETRIVDGAPWIEQSWRLPGQATVRVVVGGRLDRPALAAITETDPPAPTRATTTRTLEGEGAVFTASRLPAAVRAVIAGRGVRWSAASERVVARLDPTPGTEGRQLSIRLAMDGGARPAETRPLPVPAGGDPIADRALAYVRGCTALETEPAHRAILTDHRLLPLSWTRDAYWQALALLLADAPGDRDRVADHLRWLWSRCERPEGWWARSHHADGRRKDLGFQADQQLYPILELADLWQVAGRLPDGVDWSLAVARAWASVEAHVDPTSGLLSSGENAADDPVALPFLGASQILRWWAATRLAALAAADVLALDAAELRRTAEATRNAFERYFADDARPWPYAVDAEGGRLAYHDANDLPVALAPAWGFCEQSDPGWRATMRFAFSPDNPGWVDGPRAGLGSAHTRGPWTLGDLQAWIAARLSGSTTDADAALRRLREVAYEDGMLPEAYGADRGPRIRHWFAWPGAAYAALRMLDDRGAIVPDAGSAPGWLG